MAESNTSNIGFEKQIWDAACVLRGNMDASEYAKEKYEKQKDSITNEWTRGLVNLLISVINNDAKQLSDSHSKIEILQATSKAQHLLVKEYVYYKS